MLRVLRKYILAIFLFSSMIFIHLDAQIINKIDLRLINANPNVTQNVIVVLSAQADVKGAKSVSGKDQKANFVFNRLKDTAVITQVEVKNLLQSKGVSFRSYYMVNMITLKAKKSLIDSIAVLTSVDRVLLDGAVLVNNLIEPERNKSGNRGIEWNVDKIGAPTVWDLGYTGQNVVIGGQDTGYDWMHNTLKKKYRGWNVTSPDHNYNWHDAIREDIPLSSGVNSCGFDSRQPCDDHNHGTHTMGTMVGNDSMGNQIGVAPGAKWIGCRNMENGYGRPSTYLECFEWFLAPYALDSLSTTGDPTKMPHVINNSWGCPPVEGCDTSVYNIMRIAVDNLKLAGCVVVVSAGNSGSSCGSVNDPSAIFENSFSVGATNSADEIAGFSSRGSVTVDGSNRIKPNVSAPGVSVRSAIRNNGYGSSSGTSMAGPHVAGLVALIISANPTLAGEVDKIENIIEQTAVNLTSNTQSCNGIPGTSIPNNTYGYGRIDAVAAVNRAINELYVPLIKIDQFGYKPTDEKIAILSDPQTGYNSADSYTPASTIVVKNSNTLQVVFSGAPVVWASGATHSQSGDRVWRFDFSAFNTPGTYHVADGNSGDIRSEDFEIKADIYDDILKTAFKTFYYQRCGVAKVAPYALPGYTDGVCHAQDASCRFIKDKNNTSLYKNMAGGWHDAGDYNKYVNFAYKPINDLLWSYEINPQAWANDNMNIPESGNGIPDLLDEIKYELDWFIKMQDTDGGVFCVVGVQNHTSASPPSADNATRYYGTKTTAASLTTAASFAFASKQFKKIDHPTAQSYATTLQTKAIQAWTWSISNSNINYFNTADTLAAGEQEVDNYERDMRKLAAAVYLYDLTGDNTYKTYVESNYNNAHLLQWGFVYPFENVIQLSLLHYSHLKGVSTMVANNIKNAFRNSMNNYTHNFPAQANDLDAYKAHLETQNIGWGSNGIKCNHGNLYQAYHHFNLDAANNGLAEKTMSHYIHYMHGVNPNALTYLTKMSGLGADRSVNTIYHGWFNHGSPLWDDVRTSTYGPAPGFIPGGPNPGWSLDGCCPSGCGSAANNNLCNITNPPSNQPPLKSYKEWNTGWPQNSWSVTENGIYYQSAYLFLLSSMVNQASGLLPAENQININADIYFNTTNSSVILTSPNNTKYKINVSNEGIISASQIASASTGSTKIVNSSLNLNFSQKGIITKSPDHALWKISIGKAGELKTSLLASISGNHVQQQEGDMLIENSGYGLILTDENNICYLVSINDSGTIFTKPIDCND
ncbi:MAG: glycoside hydrolase family 9 protein [Saprospiraceae bacterium]|nr:glycoside hydrolase family 9 protein [Saprospiraceae bacterium]